MCVLYCELYVSVMAATQVFSTTTLLHSLISVSVTTWQPGVLPFGCDTDEELGGIWSNTKHNRLHTELNWWMSKWNVFMLTSPWFFQSSRTRTSYTTHNGFLYMGARCQAKYKPTTRHFNVMQFMAKQAPPKGIILFSSEGSSSPLNYLSERERESYLKCIAVTWNIFGFCYHTSDKSKGIYT